MLRDNFGLPVSADAASTVAALNQFADEVLSHGKYAGALLAAAEADSRAPLAQAYAAALYLFLQTREGVREAHPWLQRARDACKRVGGTDRETLIVSALEHWANGNIRQAAALHMEIAQRWPTDLLNLKLAQMHQINLGDRQGMARLLQIATAAHTNSAFAWGLFAFAQEQLGEHRNAERSAQRALKLHHVDPWAQHAFAHVFEARGAIRDGIEWMRAIAPDWDRCSSFMYTHHWWHLALMHLDNDQPEEALRLYDQRVWAVRKTYVQDQINAVSLLSRLECRGVDVGDRWTDLAEHVAPRIHDQQNGFIDLHYGYALARAGNDAAVAEWIKAITAHSVSGDSTTAPLWANVALPAARGMVAYARGRMGRVTLHLEPVARRLSDLGGSNAQQDWLEQIQLQALLHTRNFSRARSILGRRIRSRPAIHWQHRVLATLPITDRDSESDGVATQRRDVATA